MRHAWVVPHRSQQAAQRTGLGFLHRPYRSIMAAYAPGVHRCASGLSGARPRSHSNSCTALQQTSGGKPWHEGA